MRAGKSQSRYLGLELSGSKNRKTALVVIDYFAEEKKLFVTDAISGIGWDRRRPPSDSTTGSRHPSSDNALIALLNNTLQVEHSGRRPSRQILAVNVPTQFPPCALCTESRCKKTGECHKAEVQWTRHALPHWRQGASGNDFVPYTQRPVEVYLRHVVGPKLGFPPRILEIDEALGGARAPLTARMVYLKRRLHKVPIIEALPKLTLAILCRRGFFAERLLRLYRTVEYGQETREPLLQALVKKLGIFVYEKDRRAIIEDLTTFDAWVCALTAFFKASDLCAEAPKGFPLASGWVEHPRIAER